jgi:hypothetical protein
LSWRPSQLFCLTRIRVCYFITDLAAFLLTEFEIVYVLVDNGQPRCVLLISPFLKYVANLRGLGDMVTYADVEDIMFSMNRKGAVGNRYYQHVKKASEERLHDQLYLGTDDGKKDRLYRLQGKRVQVTLIEGEVAFGNIGEDKFWCHIEHVVFDKNYVMVHVRDDNFFYYLNPPRLHVDDALCLLDGLEKSGEICEVSDVMCFLSPVL